MVLLYIVPCWIRQLALTSDVLSGFIFGLVCLSRPRFTKSAKPPSPFVVVDDDVAVEGNVDDSR